MKRKIFLFLTVLSLSISVNSQVIVRDRRMGQLTAEDISHLNDWLPKWAKTTIDKAVKAADSAWATFTSWFSYEIILPEEE